METIINQEKREGIKKQMETWYGFQKISYLYIFLTVFTVVFLIFSFFLKKNKGRTRSSNCFLGLGGFFFSLFVLTLAAESYFYINKGSFFYNNTEALVLLVIFNIAIYVNTYIYLTNYFKKYSSMK